jgi:hypothetical protein
VRCERGLFDPFYFRRRLIDRRLVPAVHFGRWLIRKVPNPDVIHIVL